MDWVVDLLINVGYAAAILVVAFWLSGLVKSRIVALGLKYEDLDDTLFSFLASLARYAVLAFAVIFVLGRFGIQTTSLVALIGAAGLAIGLALQGTLSNLAAGVMLVAFRPFKLGDFINAAGHTGTVKQITLFTTELATLDNVQIIVPNGDIWSSAITNYSIYETRRCDMVFGVSYDSDLKKAEKIIASIIDKEERAHADPAPFIKVTNLGDSSVDFTVRAWCDRGDFFDMKCDITRAVKDAFDKGGIDIPYPTQTLISKSDAA